MHIMMTACAAAYWATCGIISTDEDPSLRIESSAIINLRGVSTKLNKYNFEIVIASVQHRGHCVECNEFTMLILSHLTGSNIAIDVV